MDQVSKVKMDFRMEQWRQRISDCQASGMSIRSWCKQNQVSEPTYYKYLKQFRQEVCDTLPIPAEEKKLPVSFKKLEIQAPLPATQAAVIIHFIHIS